MPMLCVGPFLFYISAWDSYSLIMKVNVEQEKTAAIWRYTQTVDLHYRIYANEKFQTSDGEIIHEGSPFKNSPAYRKVPCSLSGDLELIAEDFEIDSTEDSPDHPDVRYSAYIFSRDTRLTTRLIGFPVPQTAGTLTWDRLTLHRDARARSVVRSGYYDQPTVEFLIERALASLRFASEIQPGHAASSFDPLDPLFPIHVSTTDPIYTALLAGVGLVAAAGKVAMVDGLAEVDSATVAANSVIVPSRMSAGFFGLLSVRNIVPGEGFQILSTNPGDNGDVGWIMTNPS